MGCGIGNVGNGYVAAEDGGGQDPSGWGNAESEDVDGQAPRTAGDEGGQLWDVGPIVDVGGGVECAGGSWDGDLTIVGLVVEGEDLGVLFAVGGIFEVRFAPIHIVFITRFHIACYEAVAEVGIRGRIVGGVVFVETVSELLLISAAEI